MTLAGGKITGCSQQQIRWEIYLINKTPDKQIQNKVILNTKYSLVLASYALKSAFTLAPHGTAQQMYHKVNQSGVREGITRRLSGGVV